jgi:hypothetical protein
MRRRRFPALICAALLGVVIAVLALPAAAQEVRPTVPDTTAPRLRLKPSTALLRSIVLPGWGQFSLGERVRGTVYLAGHGANAFMLTKTLLKLADARSERDDYRDAARADIELEARTDTALARRLRDNPLLLEQMVDSTGAVVGAESLVQSREQQREDWITLAAFWMLASGADAFVAAHLSDFPGDVAAEPRPGGGLLLRWTLPVRRPW